jgi:hypothetical protein
MTAARVAVAILVVSNAAVFGAEPKIVFEGSATDAGVADVSVNSTGPKFVDDDNDGDLDINVPTDAHRILSRSSPARRSGFSVR